jgi:hypothetical protein
MSAVAEREVASFEELQAALEKRQAERQQLLSKLAELVQREEAERSALLRAKPDADPYAVGAKAKRFHDERAKTERAIANLEKTIEVLIGHLNEAGAVRAVEGLRELTEQAEKLKKAEDAAWRKAGRVLEELLSVWNPLAENYEERERLRGEAERENLPTQARLDAEVGSAWEQAIDFQGPRVPTDIGSLSRCCWRWSSTPMATATGKAKTAATVATARTFPVSCQTSRAKIAASISQRGRRGALASGRRAIASRRDSRRGKAWTRSTSAGRS